MDCKQPDTSKVYLITGTLGFIGYFLSKRLLEQGRKVEKGLQKFAEWYVEYYS